MFNQNIMDRLLKSTILSAIFSVIGITLTVYHHFKVQQMLSEILRKSNGSGK